MIVLLKLLGLCCATAGLTYDLTHTATQQAGEVSIFWLFGFMCLSLANVLMGWERA